MNACDQAELEDGEGELDACVASLGGMIFSSWSEAHMPAAAKAVRAKETRKRVLAGSTGMKSFLSLSATRS